MTSQNINIYNTIYDIHTLLNINLSKIYIHSLFEYNISNNGVLQLQNSGIIIYPNGDILYCVYDNEFNELARYNLVMDPLQTKIENHIKTVFFDIKCYQNEFFPYTSLSLTIYTSSDGNTILYITRTLYNKLNPCLPSQINIVYCRLLIFDSWVFAFNMYVNVDIEMLDDIKMQKIQIYYKDFFNMNQSSFKGRCIYCFCKRIEQLDYMQNKYGILGLGSILFANEEFINIFFSKL